MQSRTINAGACKMREWRTFYWKHNMVTLGFSYLLFKADKTVAVVVLHISQLFQFFFLPLTRDTLRRNSNPASTILVDYFKTFRTARADESHHGIISVSRHVQDEASQMKEHERLLSPIRSVKAHQSPSTASGSQNHSRSEDNLPQQDHGDWGQFILENSFGGFR